jgi:hypothetical protein
VLLTAFGTAAVVVMVFAYAVEARHPRFTLAFGVGCALSSLYGFLIGSLPFGTVEAVWATIAVRRYLAARTT